MMPTPWPCLPLPTVTPLTPASALDSAAVDRRRHAAFDTCLGARAAGRAAPQR